MKIATRTWKKLRCEFFFASILWWILTPYGLSRPVLAAPDPDLREYHREMALSAISNRTTSKNLRPLTTKKIDRKPKSVPLFDLDDDDELLTEQPVLDYSEVNDDDLVAYALQESFDQSNISKNVASTSQDKPTSSVIRPVSPSRDSSPEDDFYMDYPAPTRLETVLSIANADGSSRVQLSPSKTPGSILFGKPTLLTGPSNPPPLPTASLSNAGDEITMVATSRVRNDQTAPLQRPEIRRDVTPEQPASSSIALMSIDESDDDDDMEEVPVPSPLQNTSEDKPTPSAIRPVSPSRDSSSEDDFYMDYPAPTRLETALSIANADGSSRVQLTSSKSVSGSILFGKPTLLTGPSNQPHMPASLSRSDDEITMVTTSKVRKDQTFPLQRAEIQRDVTPEQPVASSIVPMLINESDDDDDMEEVSVPPPLHNTTHNNPPDIASPRPDESPSPSLPLVPIEKVQDVLPFQGPVTVPEDADLNENPLFIISRTPSPSHDAQDLRLPSPPIAEDWDAAEEMDVQAEEGEFARFISQVKGKDLSSVRKEIDDEIKALNEQKKVAMRDSEDITQQMVSQIMVWNTLILCL